MSNMITAWGPLILLGTCLLALLLSLLCRRYWYQKTGTKPHKHGLCGCYMCCRGCFCAPCMVGVNGDALDGNGDPPKPSDNPCRGCMARDCVRFVAFDMLGLSWMVVGEQRKRLREQRDIEGDAVDDCICSCCCSLCTNCQTAAELNSEEHREVHIPLKSQPRALDI